MRQNNLIAQKITKPLYKLYLKKVRTIHSKSSKDYILLLR
jgi:hypothetical protein